MLQALLGPRGRDTEASALCWGTCPVAALHSFTVEDLATGATCVCSTFLAPSQEGLGWL